MRPNACRDITRHSTAPSQIEHCPSGALAHRLADGEPDVEPDLRPEVGVVDDGPLLVSGGVRATGHPVVQGFEPGEDWFFDHRPEGLSAGPEPAAPRSHPEDQPAPGPAGAVPSDRPHHLHAGAAPPWAG